MAEEKKRTNKGAILTQLIRIVFPLNGSLLEAGDRLSGNVGLSSSLWQVLGAISGNPRSVPQIGRVMGLTRQSVQRSVNMMADDGLVEFTANPDHKTSPLVQLTPEGQSAYARVMRLQVEWSNKLAQEFKTKDLQVAVQVLQLFVDALENDK
ncbi:MAG: MarR family transcriptional regulator [Planctomycetaceae bacterium]|nr:MarR family transcriptional regulator [Planctomycetaceae bacterium]